MKLIKSVEVHYHGVLVGTISNFKGSTTAFQYSQDWVRNGFSISPFSLPLSEKIFFSSVEPFNGLFGVFDDSLPDGWGMLLTDRMLKSKGFNPDSVNSITRLSLLGNNSKGALEYKPSQYDDLEIDGDIDFDQLFEQCASLYSSDSDNGDYDKLFMLAGSSGGARPKANIRLDDQEWIVKFPSSYDDSNIGKLEYSYCEAAKRCGIRTVESRLLPSSRTSGFFSCKRFDRTEYGARVHMVSAGGLLETSHRFPVLDYSHLLKLTSILTHDSHEVENMYLLMCFNEVFHNRDDHAKNFSFIYDIEESRWKMAPAYDLTYSNSFNGEHATTINGKGLSPSDDDIITLGKNVGLKENWCRSKLSQIREVYSGISFQSLL